MAAVTGFTFTASQVREAKGSGIAELLSTLPSQNYGDRKGGLAVTAGGFSP
jgi:hypothetical protein